MFSAEPEASSDSSHERRSPRSFARSSSKRPMSVERPATFDEVRHFQAVQRHLRESFPTAKRGVL